MPAGGGHQSTADQQQGATPTAIEFAGRWREMRKVSFSSATSAADGTARPAAGDAVTAIARCTAEAGDLSHIGNRVVTISVVDVFTALGDPVRRALLRRLAEGPARVVDLAADHDISRPAVSRHLKVLGEAGLVAGTDQGRERHYTLVPSALEPVAVLLAELSGRTPRIPEHVLDALELEVRRTRRDRAGDRHAHTERKDAG